MGSSPRNERSCFGKLGGTGREIDWDDHGIAHGIKILNDYATEMIGLFFLEYSEKSVFKQLLNCMKLLE